MTLQQLLDFRAVTQHSLRAAVHAALRVRKAQACALRTGMQPLAGLHHAGIHPVLVEAPISATMCSMSITPASLAAVALTSPMNCMSFCLRVASPPRCDTQRDFDSAASQSSTGTAITSATPDCVAMATRLESGSQARRRSGPSTPKASLPARPTSVRSHSVA